MPIFILVNAYMNFDKFAYVFYIWLGFKSYSQACYMHTLPKNTIHGLVTT